MASFDDGWEQFPVAECFELDALCDRFELAFVQDAETRIEPFVVGLPQPQQRLIVRELVQLEIELRRAAGQSLTPGEYASRFPQRGEEMRALATQCLEDLDLARITKFDTIDNEAGSDDTTETRKEDSHARWSAQWRASAAAVRHSDLPADGVLGHYRLQSVIGRGGMGIVVRAHDTKLARDVAIKFLASEVLQVATAKERFLREARAAAAIRHNHVVTIHAVEEIDQHPLLVMELVEGMTLDEYLRVTGKLSTDEVASLAYQTAQGLAAAHQRSLTHRDVKPANILLEKDDHRGGARMASSWNAKIADFGLARIAAEVRLTSSGLIAGTPQYMSPEQAAGQAIDARSDLFSLGSVMYTMCAGRAPFEAESAVAIVRQVADKPARPLREVSPETPNWLIAIIEKLMAKSPDERFQSAAEVAELLGRHLQDLQMGRTIAANAADTPATVTSVRRSSRTVMLVSLAVTSIAVTAFGISQYVRVYGAREAADSSTPHSDRTEGISTFTDIDQPRDGWPAYVPAPAIAPFGTKQANSHQVAWAKHLDVSVETSNSLGMKFRVIPPGEFLMGNSDEEMAKLLTEADEQGLRPWYRDRIRFEGPQHQVTLSKPYAMSIHEVTRGQFRQFVEATGYETEAERDGEGGSGWKDDDLVVAPDFLWNTPLGFDAEQTDEHPVVNVSWNDAGAFCKWLSEKEQVTYRLPMEAEWEYACRAGSVTRFSFGNVESELQLHAWHALIGGLNTNPVGKKKPNALGLFDMHGNVAEWCEDNYVGIYSEAPAIDSDLSIDTGLSTDENKHDRVMRGGSFDCHASEVRTTPRRCAAESFRNAVSGFRLVRDFHAIP